MLLHLVPHDLGESVTVKVIMCTHILFLTLWGGLNTHSGLFSHWGPSHSHSRFTADDYFPKIITRIWPQELVTRPWVSKAQPRFIPVEWYCMVKLANTEEPKTKGKLKEIFQTCFQNRPAESTDALSLHLSLFSFLLLLITFCTFFIFSSSLLLSLLPLSPKPRLNALRDKMFAN